MARYDKLKSTLEFIVREIGSQKMTNRVKSSENLVILICFRVIKYDKPYFNNSNSSTENSNDDILNYYITSERLSKVKFC